MDAISFLKPPRIMLGFLTLKKSIISLLPLSSFLFMSLHFMKLDAFLKFPEKLQTFIFKRKVLNTCGQNLPLDRPALGYPPFCCRTSPISMVSFTLLYVWMDLYLKKKNLIFFQWSWVLKNAFVSLVMSN